MDNFKESHYCWNCKHYFEDRSVGYAGCENDYIMEEEYDKYCVDAGGFTCPYFDGISTDDQIDAEEKYLADMSKMWEEL